MKHLALVLILLSTKAQAATSPKVAMQVSCASSMASVDIKDAEAIKQAMQFYRDYAKVEIFAVGKLSHELQTKLTIIEDQTRPAHSVPSELEKFSGDLLTSSIRSKADCQSQARRWERLYGILKSDAQIVEQALHDLRKTRRDLENLRDQGPSLLNDMREGVAALSDANAKRIFEREANEFERTLMNIETAIGVLIAMENVWNVNRLDNADLLQTIMDALAASVPIHGIVSFTKLADEQAGRLQRANTDVNDGFASALEGLANQIGQDQTTGSTTVSMATQVSTLANQRRATSEIIESEMLKARSQMKKAIEAFANIVK